MVYLKIQKIKLKNKKMNRADLKHLVYIEMCLIIMLLGVILDIKYTFLFGWGLFGLILWIFIVFYVREIKHITLSDCKS